MIEHRDQEHRVGESADRRQPDGAGQFLPAVTTGWRPFEPDRDACADAERASRLVAASYRGDCLHFETSRGADIPLVHGSHRSEVCDACGAFRRRDHHWNLLSEYQSRWRPQSEYADEIEMDLDR